MKKIITIAASVMLAFAPGLKAQECNTYFPAKEGASFVMHSFNGVGKLETSSTHKVVKRVISSDHVELTVDMSVYNEKKKEHLSDQQYQVHCKGGEYSVDMTMLMSTEQFLAIKKAMQVRINSSKLTIPANARVGQELNNGSIEVHMMEGSDQVMTLFTSNVSNRKVEGIETITTPAGTFECIKITYDIETKMVFKSTGRAEEWYALGVGLVQSKTYDGKGKQQSFQQLVQITNQ